jgi:pathogenesis-related protein 1
MPLQLTHQATLPPVVSRRRRPRLPALLLALSSPLVAAGPDPREDMLAVHNRVRAEVGVPPLAWSSLLADSAQRWADHLATEKGCAMIHSGPGENLYWASAVRYSDGRREVQRVGARQVAEAWAGERRHYDPARNSCAAGQVCGHYTQMVWRGTERIGCGYRICDSRQQVWVCHYRPSGNIVGRRPY